MRRRPHRYPLWTAEEKIRVRDMLLAGMNPTAIGLNLGRPRNAICGMIWRTPMLAAAQKERVARMSKNDRYRFLFHKTTSGKKNDAGEIRAPETPPKNLRPDAYDARALKISLIDLSPNQCKFIPGNDHLSCGYPVHDGSVYCTHHMLRCKADRYPKGKERPFGWGS